MDRLAHPSPELSPATPGSSVRPTHVFIPFTNADTEQSIPQRFEQLVQHYAPRLAVQSQRSTLTYGELNRAANRVAQAILAHRGAEPEAVVLLMTHDTPGIVAMLGILKAGKTCVPLDPAAPPGRLQYILRDTQAALLVTDRACQALVRPLAPSACPVLVIEDLARHGAEHHPGIALAPDRCAYVIYTSGSTGPPKGVVKSHRTVLHEVKRLTNAFRLCADDRHTLIRALSSNGAIQDILSSILNGAAVFPWSLEHDGIRLSVWLRQHELTIYRSALTLFRHLVNSLREPDGFPRLRLIQIGGEPVHAHDVTLYKQYFAPHCVFVNTLGLTEAGPVCMYNIDKDTAIADPVVPVGYEIEDMAVLLLDETGQEVAEGEVGEIVVKSRFLAAEYWQKPERTRVAFLPDPTGGDSRLYRTGDLGRRLPDGCLVHLGRTDLQVKIRGNRIEIAEVEMALQSLDAVQEAVVVPRETQPGEHCLIAYLIPRSAPPPSVTTLRSTLAATLPDYMIPAVFMWLEVLPRLSTGKVDRQALPVPPARRPELATPFVAPRTPIEARLVTLWTALLQLDQVGIHDDFFALGGHSLLVTQLIARVYDTLHVELPVSEVFAAPTVAHMALRILQQLAAQGLLTELDSLLTEVEALSAVDVQRGLDCQPWSW